MFTNDDDDGDDEILSFDSQLIPVASGIYLSTFTAFILHSSVLTFVRM